MRIALVIPSAIKSVPKDTFYSFIATYSNLLDRLEDLPFTITRLEVKAPSTFPIDANRNMAVCEILEQGFDTSIWFDADQVFPEKMLFRLLSNPAPIVAGMYFLKSAPFFPIVYKETKESKEGGKFNWFNPIMEYPKDEPFYADMIGMGCVKIDRVVFEKIVDAHHGRMTIREAVDKIKDRNIDGIDKYLDEIMRADSLYNGAKPEFFRYGINPITIETEQMAREPLNKYRTKYTIRDVTEDVFFWKQVRELTDYKIIVDPKIQCGHITDIVSDQGLFQSYYNTTIERFKEAKPEEYEELKDKICRAEAIKSAS